MRFVAKRRMKVILDLFLYVIYDGSRHLALATTESSSRRDINSTYPSLHEWFFRF